MPFSINIHIHVLIIMCCVHIHVLYVLLCTVLYVLYVLYIFHLLFIGLAPATHSSVKRDSKGHRPPNLELAAMTTPTSATPTPGSSLFPWTDTRKLMPGTPV